MSNAKIIVAGIGPGSREDVTPAVADAVREADGLIIGAPNYFGDLCAQFKLFYERLVFPYLTYNKGKPCCNQRRIPVLLIMTSNAPDTLYSGMLENYRNTLTNFIGPTTVFVSGETMQVKDYSKYDMASFNEAHKKEVRETQFPIDLKEAFRIGAEFSRWDA